MGYNKENKTSESKRRIKMSENYIVINGKRAELTKEQIEQLGIDVNCNKRWRANKKGVYWFVDDAGGIMSLSEINGYYDDFRYYFHNYFRTQEEAETYAHVLETEMLLKKYADEHNKKFKDDVKYCLYFSDESDRWGDCIKVQGVHTNLCFRPRQVWFSSMDIALNAIKKIGKDRIAEYLTYEW